MPRRAAPSAATLDAFGDEFLVVCPRCARRAIVRDRGAGAVPRIRLACASCGLSQDRERPSIVETSSRPLTSAREAALLGAPVDAYFRLPLWLQAPCCGETLWANNAAHLDAITDYVAADLRERAPDAHGWRNASLRSRLPKWMQVAKHRAEILRCAARLRERLAD